jgi:hypothetical protein
MLSFILIQNRQYAFSALAVCNIVRSDDMLTRNPRGKTRLAKWYVPYSDEEKIKLKGEVRTFPLLSHLCCFLLFFQHYY